MTPELRAGMFWISLQGNADSTANNAFALFVTQLHAEAQRIKVREVNIDLSELYFMTSSCIKCFVTWIGFIKELPPVLRYTLNFVVSPTLRWQKRNLEVLLQLSPGLITVREQA
jgi:hypothetical protein